MKTKLVTAFIALLVFTIFLFACRKSISTDVDTDAIVPGKDTTQQVDPPPPPPPNSPIGCSYAPDYGDTLICTPPTNGQDYIVSPVNNPGTGKYLSWPIGMKIDSTTGAINVSRSESGLRYLIGFIKQGTTDTCLTELILAGAAYMDSIHVLSEGQVLALPYYNADPNLVATCATGNCQFDIGGQANSQKVKVNTATGEIDLQKTLQQGAFGLLPFNGDMVETTIYYRVNDGCNNSIQHITVQLMFFNRKSQIGSGLLGTLISKLTNILNGNIISTSANPRPPLIIITRYN